MLTRRLAFLVLAAGLGVGVPGCGEESPVPETQWTTEEDPEVPVEENLPLEIPRGDDVDDGTGTVPAPPGGTPTPGTPAPDGGTPAPPGGTPTPPGGTPAPPATPPRPSVGTFAKTHDATLGLLTLSVGTLSIQVRYKGGVEVRSLKLKGKEVLDSGALTFAELPGANFTASNAPSVTGTVSETPTTATIDFKVGVFKERWLFEGSASGIRWTLTRTNEGASVNAISLGFPRLVFKAGAWDNIHKPADGGNIPVGGRLSTSNQNARGMQWEDHRLVVRQGSFAFLNRADETALVVDRGGSQRAGTEFYRRFNAQGRALETNWYSSEADLGFTNGNPKGYASSVNAGHFSGYTGKVGETPKAAVPHLFRPITINAGKQITHSLFLSPGSWRSYYDVGSFVGVDTGLVSEVLHDFAAAQMQDRDIGGSSEISFALPKAASMTNMWNILLSEVTQNAKSFASFRAQLKDIRDRLQRPDGFVNCCYPSSGDADYYETTDNLFAYPLSIALLDGISPDDAWLKDIAASAERAFAYAESRLLIRTGATAGLFGNRKCTSEFWAEHLARFPTLPPRKQTGPLSTPPGPTGCMATFSEWNDAFAIGQVSAFQNILAFAALDKWARLETNVLKNPTLGAKYRAQADALRNKFNEDGSIGGFYSSITKTYHYTRDEKGLPAKDCFHTFPNGYGLAFGIITPSRRKTVSEQMRYALSVHNAWAYPGTNATDCSTPGRDEGGTPNMPFPLFENGGVKFLTAGPIGQFGLWANDRGYSLAATRVALTNYAQTGYWGFSNLHPKDLSVNRTVYQEPWMSNNGLSIYSLYHDLFGFQPTRTALVVRPFLHPELVGSRVRYNWRGEYPVEVTFRSAKKWAVRSERATPISVEWQGNTPNSMYTVSFDSVTQKIQADGAGIVRLVKTIQGAHEYTLN